MGTALSDFSSQMFAFHSFDAVFSVTELVRKNAKIESIFYKRNGVITGQRL